MLWLIWIVIMLVVPCIAGIKVWLDVNHTPQEPLTASGAADPDMAITV